MGFEGLSSALEISTAAEGVEREIRVGHLTCKEGEMGLPQICRVAVMVDWQVGIGIPTVAPVGMTGKWGCWTSKMGRNQSSGPFSIFEDLENQGRTGAPQGARGGGREREIFVHIYLFIC